MFHPQSPRRPRPSGDKSEQREHAASAIEPQHELFASRQLATDRITLRAFGVRRILKRAGELKEVKAVEANSELRGDRIASPVPSFVWPEFPAGNLVEQGDPE